MSTKALIPILIAASILGFYCGPFFVSRNGFGDASWLYLIDPPDPNKAGYPGAPTPVFRDYTGILALDRTLVSLVAYFSALFDGDVKPEYRLYSFWAFWQFMPISVLVILEGMRMGMKGKVAGWTSTMLFLAQILSWQFLVPLWVLLYLLTSPSAIKAAPTTILVDIKDIKVLPLTVTISMLIPTVLMFLPPSMISAKWHYASFAFWQPFPLWHYLLHKLATTTYSAFDESRSQETRYKAYLSAVRPIYNLVFFAGVIGQLPVLLALLPTVQRSQFVDHMPSLRDYTSVTISSIFMPWSPLDMPTHNSKTIVSGELAMTAVCFLHYDMYIGCGAILAGALYLHRSAVRREKLGFLLMKLLGWFAIGGFPGAISALLFERDRYVVERSEKKSV